MRVLYVATDLRDADVLQQEVRRVSPGITMEICAGLSELRARKDEANPPDVLLMDCSLTEAEQLQLIHFTRVRQLAVPVVGVMGTTASTPSAALTAGLDDLLVRGPKFADRLQPALRLSTERYRNTAQTIRDNEKLKRSEARLRLIIEALPAGVVLLDQAGKVLAMNAAGVGLFGSVSPQDIVGRAFATLIPVEDQPAFHDFLAKTTSGEEASLQFSGLVEEGERPQICSLRGLTIQRDETGQQAVLGVLDRVNTASQQTWQSEFDLDAAGGIDAPPLDSPDLDGPDLDGPSMHAPSLAAMGSSRLASPSLDPDGDADADSPSFDSPDLGLDLGMMMADASAPARSSAASDARLAELEARCQTADARVAELDAALARLHGEHDAAKAAVQAREAELAAREAGLSHQSTEAQAQHAVLTGQITQAQARQTALAEQVAQVQARETALNEQIAQGLARETALAEKQAALTGDVAQAQARESALAEQISQVQAQHAAIQVEVDTLRQAVQQEREQRASAEAQARTYAAAAAANEDLAKQAEAVAALAGDLEAARGEASALTEQLAKERAQAQMTQTQLTQSHEALAKFQGQLAQTHEHLVQAQDKIAQTQEKLAQARGDATSLQDQLSAAQKQVAQLEARSGELDVVRAERALLSEQLADARALEATARAAHEAAEATLAEQQAEALRQQSSVAEQMTRADEHARRAEAQARTVQQHEALLSAQREQISAQEMQLTEKEAQLSHQEMRLAQQGAQIAQQAAQLAQQQTQHAELLALQTELKTVATALASQRQSNDSLQAAAARKDDLVRELEQRTHTRIVELEQEHRVAVDRLQELLNQAMKDSQTGNRGRDADSTRRGAERVGRLAAAMAVDLQAAADAASEAARAVLAALLPGSPGRDAAERTLETVQRSGEMARHLLRMSTRYMGQSTRIDLGYLVRQQEALLHHLAGPDIELQFDLQGGLTSAELDAQDLTQVLTSLTVAARDALTLGGAIRIATTSQRVEQTDAVRGEHPRPLVLAVTARGYGIRPVSSATCEEVTARCGGLLTTVIEPNVSWTLMAMLPGGLAQDLDAREDLTRSA